MIDAETIKALILIVLIAVIATILRRRAGFMVVLWALCSWFPYRSEDNQDASDEASKRGNGANDLNAR